MKKEYGMLKEAGSVVVYLGPSFYGIMQKGTVIKGGFPDKFRQLLDAHPFLLGLLIPTAQLARKRKEFKIKGGELSVLYHKAEQLKEEINV